MEPLKESFRLNDLQYTLLKRNDVVALFGISGTFTDKITHYEVCKIYIRKPDAYCDFVREAIPCNEKFGKDWSRCFIDIEKANKYFDELTGRLKKLPGVLKVVAGVEEDVEVIPDYQLA